MFPFFSSSIKVESRWAAQIFVALFVATVTTGGARGETNCVELAAGDAGDATELRIVESGGGAGATNPERDTTVSVLVPKVE